MQSCSPPPLPDRFLQTCGGRATSFTCELLTNNHPADWTVLCFLRRDGSDLRSALGAYARARLRRHHARRQYSASRVYGWTRARQRVGWTPGPSHTQAAEYLRLDGDRDRDLRAAGPASVSL